MRLAILWAVVAALLAGGVTVAVTGVGDDGDGDRVALPPGPLNERVGWVLDYVNTGAGSDDIGVVFGPDFLASVPPEQVAAVTEDQLRPGGLYHLEEIRSASSSSAELLLRGTTGVAVTMKIAIEPEPPHRIRSLIVAPVVDAPPAPVTMPAGTIGARINWVLSALNDPEPPSVGAIGKVLAPSFTDQVPAEQVLGLLEGRFRPAGPFAIERWQRIARLEAAAILRGASGTRLTMSLALDPMPPHSITGLLFQPAPAEQPPSSFDEIEARATEVASEVGILIAEVVDGECRAVYAREPDRPQPIGSAFKLYVLGALAKAVADGQASWDEPAAIETRHVVHSSARFGPSAAGTAAPLQALAEAMIAVSDNTATDVVMERTGREAVEAQQARLGMAEPHRNRPFLTTRELTLLKFSDGEEIRRSYLGAGEEERRRLLDGLPRQPVRDADLRLPPGPFEVGTLEWFASAADLCRAHVGLQELAQRPGLEPVRDILAANPGQGITIDRTTWPYVAFKGGSEPGVLALSWLAERADGRTFTVTALLRDDERHIPAVISLDVAAAFQLLADHR